MIRRAATTIAKGLTVLLVSGAIVCAGTIIYARVHGLLMLSVKTGSMRPKIQPGDTVLVRDNASKLQVGDIVSYRSVVNPKATITHRIISIDVATGRIVTKGDNLETPDPPFGPDRIIGRVELVVPLVGYGFDILRNPAGLILAVYLPGLMIMYSEFQHLMRYYAMQRYRLRAYPW